ncbi:hypothetical protein JCM17380_39830 [Desulfosporosinus burensis]
MIEIGWYVREKHPMFLAICIKNRIAYGQSRSNIDRHWIPVPVHIDVKMETLNTPKLK